MRITGGMKSREILRAKNNYTFMTIRYLAKFVDCSKIAVSEILKKQSSDLMIPD